MTQGEIFQRFGEEVVAKYLSITILLRCNEKFFTDVSKTCCTFFISNKKFNAITSVAPKISDMAKANLELFIFYLAIFLSLIIYVVPVKSERLAQDDKLKMFKNFYSNEFEQVFQKFNLTE